MSHPVRQRLKGNGSITVHRFVKLFDFSVGYGKNNPVIVFCLMLLCQFFIGHTVFIFPAYPVYRYFYHKSLLFIPEGFLLPGCQQMQLRQLPA